MTNKSNDNVIGINFVQHWTLTGFCKSFTGATEKLFVMELDCGLDKDVPVVVSNEIFDTNKITKYLETKDEPVLNLGGYIIDNYLIADKISISNLEKGDCRA